MKRNPVLRGKLFRLNGFPIAALRNALDYFDANSLENLESRIGNGEITHGQLCRLRGMGTPQAPGRLLQYLYGLKDARALRAERVQAEFGAGI